MVNLIFTPNGDPAVFTITIYLFELYKGGDLHFLKYFILSTFLYLIYTNSVYVDTYAYVYILFMCLCMFMFRFMFMSGIYVLCSCVNVFVCL